MSKVIVKDYSLSAGVPLAIHQPARFFMILEATADVDLEVLRAESSVGDAEGVGVGFYFGPQRERFQGVRITSATSQTVKLCFSDGESGIKGGSVSIAGTATVQSAPVAYTQAQETVTNASAELIAANASRRFLLIQNNDTAGNIFLNLAGAAAVSGQGVKLAPGQSLLIDQACPTGAVYAIGDIASNANVVSVEG